MNIFVGNVVAITQQALWGRSLDMLAQEGRIDYARVIQQGLAKEGMKAFFTVPKFFSRVLMNCPAQGVLPWFYNDCLPHGERAVLTAVNNFVYRPFLAELEKDHTPELPQPTATIRLPQVATPTTFTAHSPKSSRSWFSWF